jgi:hypothetical protein
MLPAHPLDFGFRICRPPTCILHREAPVGVALSRRAGQPTIFPVRGTRLSSSRTALPAPSTIPNQPRRPLITPTSRKDAVGVAQRGFPRAGWAGGGGGKIEFDGVRRSDVARRRAKGAQRWRSMAPTRACSRRRHRPRTRGRGQGPRTAGRLGASHESKLQGIVTLIATTERPVLVPWRPQCRGFASSR